MVKAASWCVNPGRRTHPPHKRDALFLQDPFLGEGPFHTSQPSLGVLSFSSPPAVAAPCSSGLILWLPCPCLHSGTAFLTSRGTCSVMKSLASEVTTVHGKPRCWLCSWGRRQRAGAAATPGSFYQGQRHCQRYLSRLGYCVCFSVSLESGLPDDLASPDQPLLDSTRSSLPLKPLSPFSLANQKKEGFACL